MIETTADLYGPSRPLVEQTLSRVERLAFHEVYMTLKDSIERLLLTEEVTPDHKVFLEGTPTEYSIISKLHAEYAPLRAKLDALLSLPSDALDKRAFEGEWYALIQTELLRQKFQECYALSLFFTDPQKIYAFHNLISAEMKADFLRRSGVMTHMS